MKINRTVPYLREMAAKTCEDWINANLWKDAYLAEEHDR